MEKLVSSWFSHKIVPENYVFPANKRPGEHLVAACKAIPTIDLNDVDKNDVIHQIMNACRDFGFFQVINHGVEGKLMDEAVEVFKEFFSLPTEDKSSLLTEDKEHSCRLYTSSYNYGTEEVHYWRDALRHSCASEECIHSWPVKPNRYKEVVGALSTEVRKLGSRILEMICQGLGLEKGFFFKDGLSEDMFLTVNHYPPCPDPSLTLGLAKHCDPNLITILMQGDVPGLQVFKDGEWISVQPLKHAFIINVGYLLHIVSNGKLRSAEHRAVTNTSTPRTSAGFFILASKESVVEPAKALVDADNPPLYRQFRYHEFFKIYSSHTTGDTDAALEPFRIK